MSGKQKILPVVKTVLVAGGAALLLKRSKTDPHGPGIWEFPGGKMEFGEDFATALRREVAEETGLHARIGPLLYVASPVLGPLRQAVVLNYLSFAETRDVLLSSEHDAYHWASLAEMNRMLDGVIKRNLEENGVFEKLAPHLQ